MLRRRLAFCAALLLACQPAGVGAAGSAGLFSPDREAAPPRPATRDLRVEAPGFRGRSAEWGSGAEGALRPSELRSRAAEVDLGQLEAARLDAEGRRPHRLNLNLFADAEFDAVFERSAPTALGYTLTGGLADQPLSTVVLAVHGEWVAGEVWGPDGRYAIRPLGGGVTEVRQLDPAALGRCEVGMEASEGAEDLSSPEIDGPTRSPSLGRPALSRSAPMSETFPEDDGSVIDLLVVYPSFVRRSVGGHRAMRALIDSDVAMTNEALRVGGAISRFNLVAAVEVRRTPLEGAGLAYNGDNHELFYHLRDHPTGYMDEVPELRDSYAADFVLAHTGHKWGGVAAGAFSVSSSAAFAHELGHNMQIWRPRLSPGSRGNIPFPYSHAYEVFLDSPLPGGERFFSTIVGGGTIPRFSNAHQHYPDERGVLLGVPGDEPSDSSVGPADAVRSMNNTRRTAANHRPSASRCTYALPPMPEELPAAGGEFQFGVRAGSGCFWRAWSNDGFVSVEKGAGGIGDGEVAFQVSANDGWEREAAVFVAGEAYLIRQAAGRERRRTPVCERTPVVRDAIAAGLGKPCAEVSEADLASVRSLDLSGRGIGSEGAGRLAPGAFDGLLGLASLNLSGNALTRLEPSLFDGLTGLLSLDLSRNRLELLGPGAFDGLLNLLSLNLRENEHLTVLEPGAFKGLSNLHEMDWVDVGVRVLKRGAFDGLSNLSALPSLVVDAVEPGSFRGLSNLVRLHFSVEDATTLRLGPGVFEGLSNLAALGVNNESQEAVALDEGVFDGLAQLRDLYLANLGLKTLPPRLFHSLAKLERLTFHASELETLPPQLFNGLTELTNLSIGGGKLKTLHPDLFDGLTELQYLYLPRNELTALHPDLFHDLGSRGGGTLRWLHLDGNNLTDLHPKLLYSMSRLEVLNLAGNDLTDLDPALFRGLLEEYGGYREYSDVNRLSLANNRLANLDPSLFRHMTKLERLNLAGNQLNALPPSLFEGTILLRKLGLWDNPGAPFIFRPELVSLPGGSLAADGGVEVAVQVAEGAPFDMRVGLEALGGTLSAQEALIRTGRALGEPIVVTPSGLDPITVRALAPAVPGASPCHKEDFESDSSKRCLGGVRMSVGVPLVLHGLPDQTLVPDGAVRFDLSSAFPDFPAGTTFVVELDDPAVAEAAVTAGLLTVAAVDGGLTSVTVTATDPDGRSATLTFTVTVEQAANSYWSGWRSVLLKSPSSADGDGS